MLQNGSVQNAVKYLFDGSSRLGFSVVQSAEITQSSTISGLSLSEHPVSKMLQVSNEMKSQNFFMGLFLMLNCSMSPFGEGEGA